MTTSECTLMNINTFDTMWKAEADRVDCNDNMLLRLSDIIEISIAILEEQTNMIVVRNPDTGTYVFVLANLK